jgi:hypothetical protein
MKFEINKIKPSMTHEEKVYEYARRISHYSSLASKERHNSKNFNCSKVDENAKICNEFVGCSKRDSIIYERIKKHDLYAIVSDSDFPEKCEGCKKASEYYDKFREAKSKQGAAMRQLNKEMKNP